MVVPINIGFIPVKQVNNQNKFSREFQNVVYFDKLFVIYQKLEIEDDFQVVSQFLCLLGHPVPYINC